MPFGFEPFDPHRPFFLHRHTHQAANLNLSTPLTPSILTQNRSPPWGYSGIKLLSVSPHDAVVINKSCISSPATHTSASMSSGMTGTHLQRYSTSRSALWATPPRCQAFRREGTVRLGWNPTGRPKRHHRRPCRAHQRRRRKRRPRSQRCVHC